MRIIAHLDKRTAHSPCLFDLELDISPKDSSFEEEYGRAYVEVITQKLEAVPGFKPARKRLRGCPSVVLRYRRGAGTFSAPDSTGMDWAPHIRVAFANFAQAISEAGSGADGKPAERPEAACRACRHCEERPADARSYTWMGRPIINARLRPYCTLRGDFVSFAIYDGGCEKREPVPQP